MKTIVAIMAALALVLLTGCASTGSSALASKKAQNGETQVWYVVGGTGSSHIDERKTLIKAAQRCEALGYDGVSMIGGETVRHCREDGGPAGCARWMITKQYPCVFTGASLSP